MKIYILGFPGSGKSTVAKRLATVLKYSVVDIDTLIEQKFGITISEYFSKYGQKSFREQERTMLQTTANMDNVVVATGGGTPCFYDNMLWMNQHGITVYLSMTEKALYSRLKNNASTRPLMTDNTDLLAYITRTLAERKCYYEQAKIKVNGLDLDVKNIAMLLKKYAL